MSANVDTLSQVTEKKNFFCQNLCGEVDFDINEWNKAFKFCIDLGMNEKQMKEILDPDGCKTQCNACINVVLDRQAANKKKYGW